MLRGICAVALVGLSPAATHSGLVINEALPAPHADWSGNAIPGEPSDEWIEIANVGTDAVMLEDHYVAAAASPDSPRTGLAGMLPAGERLLVTGEHAIDWQSANGRPAEGLGLGDAGDALALFRASGGVPECVDALSWGPVATDVALGRMPDGTGPATLFDALADGGTGPQPTPGGANGGIATPKILEVACEPRAPTSADAVTLRALAADADGIAEVTLFLRVDGGPAQLFAMTRADGSAERGTWETVLAPRPAGTRLDWKVRISDGTLLAETNEFTLRVADVQAPGVWLNEILADPPPDPDGDANGDGVRNSADDEFVEIINRGASPIDLSNWSLADSTGVRHVFPAGLMLDAGDLYVVFGGGTPTGIPAGASVASTGTLSLNNTADQVRLLDAANVVKDSHPYGSEANGDQSLIRLPDGEGAWTRPLDAGFSWRYSPGQLNAAPSAIERTSWARVKTMFQR
jgi:hypothetical protein